jgi:hypothetical protein
MSDQDNFRAQAPYPPYAPSQQQTTGMRQPSGPINAQAPPRQTMPMAPPNTAPAPPSPMEAPPTVTNPYYLAGYLRQFIGRFVRIEFALGTTGSLNDRIGFLQDVGASYVVLRQFPSNDMIIGDLYSIKFVTVYAATPPTIPT